MALVRLFNAASLPAAVAAFFRSTNPISVVSGAFVKMLYGSTGYDQGGVLNVANSRFVIPSNGIYTVTFKGVFQAHATGYRALGVYVDGALDMYADQPSVGAGDYTEFEITYPGKYVVGQVIEFYLWHNAGVTLPNCFAEMYITKNGDT